ncbi:MAG: hypothetical protein IJ842_01995 [Bacilli bacterium]|nr:hypothetical protein [Bacilli bacterium]
MEENKVVNNDTKKNSSNMFIIVLLVLLIIGLVGYILYDKELFVKKGNKENNNVEEKEKLEEVKEVTKREDELYDYLQVCDFLTGRVADKYPISNFKSLSNQDVLYHGVLYGVLNKAFSFNGSFSQGDLKKQISSLFGSDYNYIDEDIQCFAGDGALFTYDSDGKVYSRVMDGHGHGGEGGYAFKRYFDSATLNEEKGILTIKVKNLFGAYYGDIGGPVENFYATAEDVFKKGLYETDEIRDGENEYDIAFEKFKDLVPITTFTFSKNSDGNYGLRSVSIDK